MQPFPFFKWGYRFRYWIVSKLLKQCGEDLIVKSHCYFGNGSRLSIGNRSQLGQNSRLNGTISIGADVLMGPDVVIMATSHAYKNLDLPIICQGEATENPVVIGDDVWIGTRVVILPGVKIGSHSIIGAGAIVTKSFPDYAMIGGNPAKLIKLRNSV